jgi:hypothetical protein
MHGRTLAAWVTPDGMQCASRPTTVGLAFRPLSPGSQGATLSLFSDGDGSAELARYGVMATHEISDQLKMILIKCLGARRVAVQIYVQAKHFAGSTSVTAAIQERLVKMQPFVIGLR